MKKNNFHETIELIRAGEEDTFQVNEAQIEKDYQVKFDNQSSISIKILTIFGGLIATLCFAGFIAVAGFYENEFGMLILGGILIASSIGLNMASHSFFIGTLSVSAYLLGLLMMGFGWGSMDVDPLFIKIIFLAISILTLFFVSNYVLTFIATALFFGAISSIFMEWNHIFNISFIIACIGVIYTSWLLFEAKLITMHPKIARKHDAIRDGLLFSFLLGIVFSSFQYVFYWRQGSYYSATGYITSAIYIICLLYVLHLILKKLEINDVKSQGFIYFFSLLFFVLLLPAPAILASLLILLLGFYFNFRASAVLGVIGLVYFFSKFYYDLSMTLLYKSLIMMAAGLLFIGFYLLAKKYLDHEKI